MELRQQWLYVINHGQNLNLANTGWDHYLAKFYQKVCENVYVWGRGYCQYRGGCACSFRKMLCPLHLSFGKEQKLSRDLYDEISWEWWHSKGTFAGATGSFQPHLLHCKACLKLPRPTDIHTSPTRYLSCCPVLRVALGGTAGEQIASCFLLRPLYPNYSQIPHLQEALSVLPVGFVLGQITVLTGTPR